MSIITYNEVYYLRNNLTFSYNLEEAVILEVERLTQVHVSKYGGSLVRLKIGDLYIGVTKEKVHLTAIRDDSSVMVRHNDNIISVYGALTMEMNTLTLEDVLITEEPRFTNRLCIESNNLVKLVNEGIIAIPSTYKLDEAAQLVHDSPHTRISNLFELNSQLMWQLLNDPALHNVLKKIFPSGYHCTTFSSNNLRKGTDERGWHCDYPYHDMESPYPSETLGVQVIWTLDDFTKRNGATYFVPGSHKLRSWPNQYMNNTNIRQAVCSKGNIVIFFGKLWHTQGINTTENQRAALLANFSPFHVDTKDPIREQVPHKFVINGQVRF